MMRCSTTPSALPALPHSAPTAAFEIRAGLGRAPGVIVTELGLLDLIVLRSLDVLVDARMQKYLATPDLRRLARLTIGLGPGFCGGDNCDVAIETRPDKAGQIIRQGPTDPPDGVSRRLGIHAGERFVRSEFSGRWKTAIEIGTRVFKDFVVGHLGNTPVHARRLTASCEASFATGPRCHRA